MSFTNRVSQTLHEEHRATIAMVERLEQLLSRHRKDNPPKVDDPAVSRLLRDVGTWIEGEIERHFDFEEQQLFKYLAELGDAAIGAHLTGEHSAMRPLGARLAALAGEAAGRPFEAGAWDEFRRLGLELCDRMLAHVQKEEMALLPILEGAMDPDTDARLYQEYVDTM